MRNTGGFNKLRSAISELEKGPVTKHTVNEIKLIKLITNPESQNE